ncbi:MAG: hypothetical protein ACOYLI_10210 [Synechococcus lacustris]
MSNHKSKSISSYKTTNSSPGFPNLKDALKFTLLDGQVNSIQEYEHGQWRTERISAKETYSFDGTNLIKTETEKGRTKTITYADINGDGNYIKISSSYGQAVAISANSPTNGTSLSNSTGIIVHDGYHGGDSDDAFNGDGRDDDYYGGAGNDVIRGGLGRDSLRGESGHDSLYGDHGNDILTGAAGSDLLTGGSGADQFAYTAVGDSGVGSSNHDSITDFHGWEGDRLNLSAIDANGLITGDQSFTWINSRDFSGAIGELRYGSGLLQADTDGDRLADFEIAFTGVPQVNSAAIVF